MDPIPYACFAVIVMHSVVAVSSTSADRQLLFGLMLGDHNGGALSGIEAALDEIKGRNDLLPGYRLNYALVNTQDECNRTAALDSLFSQILHSSQQIIALIGAGCSVATEATAEVSHYYNVTQISCASSSEELSDRVRFPYYFQLLPSEINLARVFYSIIKQYGWRRVALIVQNEHRYRVTMRQLKQMLNESQMCEYVEILFDIHEGLTSLDNMIAEQARIFVLAMDSKFARQFSCLAHSVGMKYPQYLFLTYGSYESQWWALQMDKEVEPINCSPEDRAEVLQFSFAALHFPSLFSANTSIIINEEYGADNSPVDEHLLNEHKKHSHAASNVSSEFEFYHQCHDATLALALALNQTIRELKVLNSTHWIDYFNYNDSFVAQLMKQHLHDTSFTGISGPVHFDKNGIRVMTELRVLQYRTTFINGTAILEDLDPSSASLRLVDVAYIEGNETNLQFLDGSKNDVWSGYTPYDGVTEKRIVTVNISVTVLFTLVNIGGLLFAVTCFLFTLVCRRNKLIRLNSPNLNYLIILGMSLLYFGGIGFVIPTLHPQSVPPICLIRTWLLIFGYTSGFGTIVAKLWRVYYIFRSPQTAKRKSGIQDWHLMLFVLILIFVDVAFMCVHIILEGVVAHFNVMKIISDEKPVTVEGILKVRIENFFYRCSSHPWIRDFIQVSIYSCLGVLQVCALYFAFHIRKVKVKGLNDAKYTAITVYFTTIAMILTLITTFTLSTYITAYAVIYGICIWATPTIVLGVLFIPKMLSLYKDLDGEGIFSAQDDPGQVTTVHNMVGGALAQQSDLQEENNNLKKRVKQLEDAISEYQKDLATNDGPMESMFNGKYSSLKMELKQRKQKHATRTNFDSSIITEIQILEPQRDSKG